MTAATVAEVGLVTGSEAIEGGMLLLVIAWVDILLAQESPAAPRAESGLDSMREQEAP